MAVPFRRIGFDVVDPHGIDQAGSRQRQHDQEAAVADVGVLDPGVLGPDTIVPFAAVHAGLDVQDLVAGVLDHGDASDGLALFQVSGIV